MNTADLGLPVAVPSTALFTDQYELTMLQAALRSGTADRRSVFEVFTRRLPEGRRYGVVAGTGRVLDAVENFHFDETILGFLRERGILDTRTLDWLADYRFRGDIWGYPEGEVYFPGSPIMRVEGTFAEAVLLETVILSILNHDSAVAAAASRMAVAAGDRPLIEMGARRTHELAAVAAARSAYVGGFHSTSDLAAGFRYNIPTVGTSAHSFTLLHDSERDAFQAQVDSSAAAPRCSWTPSTSPRRSAPPWRSRGPASAPYASTPATCCCSPTGSASSWTSWAPKTRRSS